MQLIVSVQILDCNLVSASTHNQAFSALLFLYLEVLNIDLPWLNNIGRPQQTKRIPSVLTKDEV